MNLEEQHIIDKYGQDIDMWFWGKVLWGKGWKLKKPNFKNYIINEPRNKNNRRAKSDRL